ncbi:Hypothetical protein, putative [Bodo saltans]|uniref:Uncharacterized protein n=1 Tax=Bodo saltans TaxID=75058 RepID=A0A0S4IVJ9_BODSA|nr:Hypothetical protein, putative [Bodo saltans]|eukprot:CUG19880.1 Hypothetical protein, putative [Bodo saltans]
MQRATRHFFAYFFVFILSDQKRRVMVCDKIYIVDVDAALKNNGEILRDIKDKYPSIAQLFHFRKSHQVHFVGAASAQDDIYLAMNDVFAAVGEPFNFSEDDKTLFLKLVEEITPDKMEVYLRDHCNLFAPNESFARDDKLRHGWRNSGPAYGVRAPTPKRRTELLVSCVMAINRQFGIHLALLGVAAPLTQQVADVPAPQPPTQTWAQESKLTFQELQLKHLEQQHRQQGLLAFITPPLSVPETTSRITVKPPTIWPSAYPLPETATRFALVTADSSQPEVASDPQNVASLHLTPDPSQHQPPTAKWYVSGVATHEDVSSSTAQVDGSTTNNALQRSTNEVQSILDNLVASSESIIRSSSAPATSAEKKTSNPPQIGTPLVASHLLLANVTQPITSTQVIAYSTHEASVSAQGAMSHAEYSQSRMSSKESETGCTPIFTKADATRRFYIRSANNFVEFSSTTIGGLGGVVVTISDEYVDLKIPEKNVAFNFKPLTLS